VSQQELLKSVVEALDRAGCPYFITGSTASSLQGEPRATHDIDVVVALAEADVPALESAFTPPRYYFDAVAAAEAIRAYQEFNVIDAAEGLKVDFWVMKDEPYGRSAMARRQRIEAFGIAFWVSSPEDTILSKLWWAVLSGGSEKQFRDALRVYEIQAGGMAAAYLDEWAGRLGVTELLARLREEAKPL